MSTLERNEKAKQYVEKKLDFVATLDDDYFIKLNDLHDLSVILNDLINVSAMGFRGVVATAITGKYLDKSYDPLNNFYACNPRAIFELGIFYAFENRVPCGKSDPLNVAKNINVLNEEWAKGKRPQKAAQAAVDYLRIIESRQGDDQELVIDLFFYKLLEYANSITAIETKLPDEQEWSNQLFASKLVRFVLEYPESGTTPQLVISRLLEKVYENSNVKVEGGDESVFGTNTTSKKPADIWLELDGSPFSLFEVTVKKVDFKRLDDCIQSLSTVDLLDLPLHFICRLPADIDTLHGINDGILKYKGKTFNFLDIRFFIHSLSSLLKGTQIDEVMHELQAFVQKIDRPVKTKEGWISIFNS